MKVVRTRSREHGKETWIEGMMSDLRSCGLKRYDAQNREKLKDRIDRNLLTLTGANIEDIDVRRS